MNNLSLKFVIQHFPFVKKKIGFGTGKSMNQLKDIVIGHLYCARKIGVLLQNLGFFGDFFECLNELVRRYI